MTNIFVYGTLMFPEIVFALTGKRFEMEDAFLDGYRRYAVAKPGRDITFKGPALMEETGSKTEGIVIFDVDDESLNILDKNEGEYTKRKVRVHIGSKDVEAVVYLGSSFGRQHLKGDWNEREFREKWLDLYVQKFIPERLKKWGLE